MEENMIFLSPSNSNLSESESIDSPIFSSSFNHSKKYRPNHSRTLPNHSTGLVQ